MGDFLQPNPVSAHPGLSAGPNDLVLVGGVFGLAWFGYLFPLEWLIYFHGLMQIGCPAKLNEELKQGRAVIPYGGGSGCVCVLCVWHTRMPMRKGRGHL